MAGTSLVWDGVILSKVLSADEREVRHHLADAAKHYNWDAVVLALHRRKALVNATRPDGTSLYTPLHQAAYGGASEAVVGDLLELGAWRTMHNARGERAVDVAEKRGHTHLVPLLTPDLRRPVPAAILAKMQEYFHATINGRADALVQRAGLRLPQLDPLMEFDHARFWFPVPGMYGGFAYRLASDGVEATLVCESWCRVVGGSGERHEINSAGSRLVAEGFV